MTGPPDDLHSLRMALGEGTRVWAPDGVTMYEDRWTAFSGAASVDYNVAMCQAASGGEHVRLALQEVLETGDPAVIMICGEALGEVQPLIEAGWVCIGSTPMMFGEIPELEIDRDVRRLEPGELQAARDIVADVFDLPPEHAAVALPDALLTDPRLSVWGLFVDGDLASCEAYARVEDHVVGWSLGVAAHRRRQGLGKRMSWGSLAALAAEGVRSQVFYASSDGTALHTALGCRELERWQMWSRPRWVLGRA